MKLSLITAAYNSEKTIGECIASINKQTYKHIEHILVDGHSTDETVFIVKNTSKHLSKVISEPDNGIYDAINKGIRASSGEVIGCLHSDDLIPSKDTFEKIMIEFIADPNLDIIYGDLHYVSRTDLQKKLRVWLAGQNKIGKIKRGWMPPHPTVFVRKNVFDQFGVYNLNYKVASDYDKMLQLFLSERLKIKYMPICLSKMRVGGVSNRSIKNIIMKTREDYLVAKSHGLNPIIAVAAKNVRKVPQFLIARLSWGKS